MHSVPELRIVCHEQDHHGWSGAPRVLRLRSDVGPGERGRGLQRSKRRSQISL